MYHLVTPCDNRFLVWRIDLNRGCTDLGSLLNKCPSAELHLSLPKSSRVMAKFVSHLEKESDRIVELVGALPVITQLPDALQTMNNLESLSISSGSTEDYSYRFPDYSGAVPILHRHANSLKSLCLSHFNNKASTTLDFQFKALKDLHLRNYMGDIDFALDFVISKCTDSLETLTLSNVQKLKSSSKNDYSTLASLKKLTVDGNNFYLDWSLPYFLKEVCPGIRKVVLKGVHLPFGVEKFSCELVVEELYMHNCRFDNAELSSLLTACSSSLKTLHIRQDDEYCDEGIFDNEKDWVREEYESQGEYDIIHTMFKTDFKLRNLEDLTFVTQYGYNVKSLTKAFGSKLPAGVNIVIKSAYED